MPALFQASELSVAMLIEALENLDGEIGLQFLQQDAERRAHDPGADQDDVNGVEEGGRAHGVDRVLAGSAKISNTNASCLRAKSWAA